jgi:GH43 family beta-xylosidase
MRRLAFLFCLALTFLTNNVPAAAFFTNPIIADGQDPWILYKDDFYYYTQTTGGDVTIKKAARLTGATGLGNAARIAIFYPPVPNNKDVWAPELHFLRGKWYAYYAADDGTNANHRVYVAETTTGNPTGPYIFKGKVFDATTDRWAIDATVLQKDDGSLYMIWSGWPGSTDGQQNLYIAPMSNPWTISGPRVMIATPTYSWEGWIQEGPEIIKRNGKIFIVYSANASWTDSYCLGLLTNTNGDVMNPASWTKSPNPIFKKYSDASGGVYGPGHCSFTKSMDQKEDWIVYHAAKFSGAGWDRDVRTQKFSWNANDSPNLGHPIPGGVNVAVPSGEDIASPPVIIAQPRSQTVVPGEAVTFNISVNGTAPYVCYWKHNGTLLATTSGSLALSNVQTNHAGDYSVTVSNISGVATSEIARLGVNPNPRLGGTELLWTLAPDQRYYLTTNLTERGLAYNPVSKNLLVLSRAANTTNIYVLSGETGADLYPLSLDTNVVTGGTYPLNLVGIADDGVVYAANLATLLPVQFRLYRWANDGLNTLPTLAFNGDPSLGSLQRWGDTMDVRGSGTNTQIILGSRAGTVVSVLTTTNGTSFTAKSITVSGVTGGSMGLGIAFGQGNTFWAKSTNSPLRQISFDLASGTGQVVQTIGAPGVPESVVPIGVSERWKLLGGINVESPDHLKLYELGASGGTTQITTNLFTANNPNTFYVGAVTSGRDRIYALNPNNGILALRLLPFQPRINSFSFLSGNQIGIQCTADPRNFIIEATSNFSDWTQLTNAVPTNGYLQAFDPDANSPFRFYRFRVP